MSDAPILLGRDTDYPQRYSPEVLFPITRHEGREALGLAGGPLPFHGVDLWTHYEVSWLDFGGKPRVAIAEIRVPASSPCLIESKSMKLYFNSLNFERFGSAADFLTVVMRDLSGAAGAPVDVELLRHDAGADSFAAMPGECLDELPVECSEFQVNPALLQADDRRVVSETLHSHLLRSCCPVTHQPDWASLMIAYQGPVLDRKGLLAYLVSYRNQSDFHEQCVERIFMDIRNRCGPTQLTVYARYTRRGGLDINPWRSTEMAVPPRLRQARQ
ncbi:MAG: queF [Moraxellaceae bacterium]|jgi:7-cyano-7-deazaguanine reductase|nr:queF [Moraxellaceae bacterium]